MERSAKALVQSTRAVAYAGRVTPRGFTVINGGARVFTLESYTQIGQTEAVGQLGIDEESLLMLLVALAFLYYHTQIRKKYAYT